MKQKSSDIFKSRIKELMVGKKQTVVSKEIGIAQNTLSDYIHLGKNPTYTSTILISKYFGVSADWLLGLSDIKSTDKAKRESCLYLGLSDEALDRIRFDMRLKEIVEWCARVNETNDFEKLYKIFEILKSKGDEI